MKISLVVCLNITLCVSVLSGQYTELEELPTAYRTYLEIPVQSIECCFNWCDGREECEAFDYSGKTGKCKLLADVYGLVIGPRNIHQQELYVKSIYGEYN
jgi:hypothetical protein